MIFAAGLGTRLKPLTDHKPKALVDIGGKTLLERSVTYLKNYGINDITINVHHHAQQIRHFLKQQSDFGISIHVSDETDMLLDTGGGLLKAKEYLEGKKPVLLMNVDILTNLDLYRFFHFHKTAGALASLVVRQRKTSRYLLFNRENQLCGWKNHSTGEVRTSRPNSMEEATPVAFSGIHMIGPELFSLIRESGRFSIIDLYLRLSTSEKIVAFEDDDSVWMDLGKFEDIAAAEKLVQQTEKQGKQL